MSALRLTVALVAFAVAAACVRPGRIAQALPRDQLYAGLVGQWQGIFEYRDADDPSRTIARPTQLQVVPAPDEDGLELRYTYRTAAGTVVRRVDHLHFDRVLQHARWGVARDSASRRYAVQERQDGADGASMRLVLVANDEAEDGVMQVRETFEVSAGTVRLVQETQGDGQAPEFQQGFWLRRAE